MIKLLIIIGIVIGLILIYFMVVALLPGFKVQSLPLAGVKATPRTNTVSTASARKDVSFTVKGDAISAWLYLPEAIDGKIPCVVMANGTG